LFFKIGDNLVDWHIYYNHTKDDQVYIWLSVTKTYGNYPEYDIKTVLNTDDDEKNHLYNARYDGSKFFVKLKDEPNKLGANVKADKDYPAFDEWYVSFTRS
jgi:hypothetical protein